jgi:hypothetical protein
VTLLVLCLAAGCGTAGDSATAPDLATVDPEPACPPAKGQGTVSPAISIYAITFVVNGLEQVVRDGDTLQASPRDQVRVAQVTICTGPFSGSGGDACVDFAPVDGSGEEIVPEHMGTHMVPVAPGFVSIPGPADTWILGEDWAYISAVVNHWTPEQTGDLDCAAGRCERDDRIIVEFR